MKKLFILITLMFSSQLLLAQHRSTPSPSILFSAGYAYSNMANGGGGLQLGVGTQLSISNRLRFEPEITVGMYSNWAEDVPKAHYNITSVNLNLHGDVVDITPNFSFFMGTGLQGNYFSGLRSGWLPRDEFVSEFFYGTAVAVNGFLGFRAYNPSRKTNFELKLFNFSLDPFAPNDYFVFSPAQLRILVRI
ncbi:hypothetical protein [Algivirga pacifica]|uniref:Outer membrane protein beta-barrel domain-containing protein n=1 Tax=Algivirga pacifica TaxID=1162670 RepID=A0ABP9DHD1_9BACT